MMPVADVAVDKSKGVCNGSILRWPALSGGFGKGRRRGKNDFYKEALCFWDIGAFIPFVEGTFGVAGALSESNARDVFVVFIMDFQGKHRIWRWCGSYGAGIVDRGYIYFGYGLYRDFGSRFLELGLPDQKEDGADSIYSLFVTWNGGGSCRNLKS